MSGTTYHQPQRAKRGDRDFVMSRTELRAFADNPHGWLQTEDDVSGAMSFGALVDAMLLDPQAIQNFAVRPDTYLTKAKTPAEKKRADENGNIKKTWSGNSNTCRQWLKEAEESGKQIISKRAFQKAEMAAHLARQYRISPESGTFGELIASGETQVILRWSYLDSETGIEIPLKAMLDLIPEAGNTIIDLKTAAKADPQSFLKCVEQDSPDKAYYYQAGFYLWGFSECKETPRQRFAWHVIETGGCDSAGVPMKSAFTQAQYFASPDHIQKGIQQARIDLAKYARCLADGKFPQYTPYPLQLETSRFFWKDFGKEAA